MRSCCSKLILKYISGQSSLLLDFSFHAVLLSLPGDLENFKKNPFVLKEGVEYRIKINFKVSESGLCQTQGSSLFVISDCWSCDDVTAAAVWAIFVLSLGNCWAGCDACLLLQVNKEIVSGLKYTQQTFRKGVKRKAAPIIFHLSSAIP